MISTLGGWYDDTINAMLRNITPAQWAAAHGVAKLCSSTSIGVSPSRRGQISIPLFFPTRSLETQSAILVEQAFAYIAILVIVAIIGSTFHRKRSIQFICARIYLWICGERPPLWRRIAGGVIAMMYYGVQLVVGIAALPVAISSFVLNDIVVRDCPSSDKAYDVGQWGPLVGALLIVIAVAIKPESTADVLRQLLSWLIYTPLQTIFPTCYDRRHLPKANLDTGPL